MACQIGGLGGRVRAEGVATRNPEVPEVSVRRGPTRLKRHGRVYALRRQQWDKVVMKQGAVTELGEQVELEWVGSARVPLCDCRFSLSASGGRGSDSRRASRRHCPCSYLSYSKLGLGKDRGKQASPRNQS